MGYVGKFGGTLLPALYCGVPSWEAVTLALIMCSKGIIEVATYIMWKDANVSKPLSLSLSLSLSDF
jgi:predicted membrane channel-forming protein YqfA (hemolysin III family)